MSSLLRVHDTLFVSTRGSYATDATHSYGAGIFRSTDGGDMWYPINSGLTEKTVWALMSTEGRTASGIIDIYAGTRTGLFVSHNFGRTWQPFKNSGLTGDVWEIAVIDSFVFARTSAGIFRTSSSIDDWLSISPIPGGLPAQFLAKGSELFAVSGGTLYRSIDRGMGWFLANGGLPVSGLNRISEVDGALYTLFNQKQTIFRSTDSGGTWEWCNSGLPVAQVTAIAGDPQKLVAACDTAFYVSFNRGASWTRTSGDSRALNHCLLVYGDTVLSGTHGAGVFVSKDLGKHWSTEASGIVNTDISALASDGSTLVAAVSWRGVATSTDQGRSWSISQSGLQGGEVFVSLAVDGDVIFGSTSNVTNRCYLSTNGGRTWALIPGLAGYGTVAVDGAKLYTANPAGFFFSSDSGRSWTNVNGSYNANVVNDLGVVENKLLAATISGIFVSSNDGTNWSRVDTLQLWTLAANRTGLFTFQARGIYGSFDQGNSWTELNVSFDGVGFPMVCYRQPEGLASDSSYFYVGTIGGGVCRIKRPAAADVAINQMVPKEVQLEQNYPNPFNPSTTIRYGLPNRSHVTLTFFNTLGQQIAQLVDGEVDAGYHEVKFDGSGLSSGVYLYRMQAGSYVETKKLLLVR